MAETRECSAACGAPAGADAARAEPEKAAGCGKACDCFGGEGVERSPCRRSALCNLEKAGMSGGRRAAGICMLAARAWRQAADALTRGTCAWCPATRTIGSCCARGPDGVHQLTARMSLRGLEHNAGAGGAGVAHRTLLMLGCWCAERVPTDLRWSVSIARAAGIQPTLQLRAHLCKRRMLAGNQGAWSLAIATAVAALGARFWTWGGVCGRQLDLLNASHVAGSEDKCLRQRRNVGAHLRSGV